MDARGFGFVVVVVIVVVFLFVCSCFPSGKEGQTKSKQ